MKKNFKKILATFFALVMIISATLVTVPQNVAAATKKDVYWDPYNSYVNTYCTTDEYTGYYLDLNIVGCTKKSQIKNLKSSNKNIKVKAKNGCIQVLYRDKAEKTKISCTVNGVKLKTDFTVKKYSNPCKSIKLGKTNLTSKFKSNWSYNQKKNFNKQKLDIKMNKNWIITSVEVSNGNDIDEYPVNSTKFSKKITIKGKNSNFVIYCYNTKTKVCEALTFSKK